MSFLRICFLFLSCIFFVHSSGYSDGKKVEKAAIVKKTSSSAASQSQKKVVSPKKASVVTKVNPEKPQDPAALVTAPIKPIQSVSAITSVPSTPVGVASKPTSKQPTQKKPVSAKPTSQKTIQKKTISTKPVSTKSALGKPASTKQASPKSPIVKSPQPLQIPSSAQNSLKAPVSPVLQSAALKDQKLVVIDPGHGGYDLGARISACDEKSLALSTALLTKKYLTEMGYRVILTRSRDVFLPLEKRTSIANETKSKLFVSIHYNSAPNPVAKGIEVFYCASEDKIRKEASKKLATRVLSKVIDRTKAETRGTKEGKFYVIRETKMPAILIEAGFMTHPDELHLLKDINYRDKIARGIAEGVDSFFKL